MDRLFAVAAFATLVAGARHFINRLSRKRKDRLQSRKLEVWESEGGAVPVHSTHTAAQVAPRRASGASPRSVG
jgi:hypothetical protein